MAACRAEWGWMPRDETAAEVLGEQVTTESAAWEEPAVVAEGSPAEGELLA